VKSADAVHTTMQALPSDPEQQASCSVPRKPCPGQDALSYCPADPAPHQCSSQVSSHYSHAQYGNRSVAFIKQAAKSDKPFFVFVGTTGPHLPSTPAPWHQSIANSLNISAPRSPNFNMLAADHFDLLSTHPILTPDLVGDIDHLMRNRWGVLMSIDDLVAGLHDAVEEAGLLDSTYFLFSSDHVRPCPSILPLSLLLSSSLIRVLRSGLPLGAVPHPDREDAPRKFAEGATPSSFSPVLPSPSTTLLLLLLLQYETDIRIPLFVKGECSNGRVGS